MKTHSQKIAALAFAYLSLGGLSACSTSQSAPSRTLKFPELVAYLDAHSQPKKLAVNSADLQVFSTDTLPYLKAGYTNEDLAKLESFLNPSLAIRVSARGLVQAADRVDDGTVDPTHYDAVWLRDSLWVYLGLAARPATRSLANKMLRTLADYLGSEAQRARLNRVIAHPKILYGADGSMQVVHIRFDGQSPTFDDVHIDGKPQTWNHKQNDALGLWYDLTLRALRSGEIALNDLSDAHFEVLASFPAYFQAVNYAQMEDAGAWEEIERTNSSSIGLVTSSLERLNEILSAKTPADQALAKKLQTAAKKAGPKIASVLSQASVAKLLNQGYSRVAQQIAAGGESPLYPQDNPRYRKADAALLNLIYPAQLNRLTSQQERQIMLAVEPLIGEVGIRRYLRDSYQSGNFWFAAADTATDNVDAAKKTDDTSSANDFNERGKGFLAGSEAQWFFDSWYSKVAGVLYARRHDSKYRDLQVRFFNRALAQLTASNAVGADGKRVPAHALPESYNSIVSGGQRRFAPSPITPLNWSKASLALALEALKSAP